MNYRFLHLTTFYPGLVKQFIKDQSPDYRSKSYDQLLQGLINTRFGWSDFFIQQMRKIGNPSELIIGADFLQEVWARERGLNNGTNFSLKRTLLTQIIEYKPDVVLLEDLYFFDFQFRKELREHLKSTSRIIGWHSAPIPDFSSLNDLDLVLTGSRGFRDKFRSAGAKAELLNLAFDPIVNAEVGDLEQDLAFTFTGSLGVYNGHHSERYKLIKFLLQNTNIQVWSDVVNAPKSQIALFGKKILLLANNVLGYTGAFHISERNNPLIGKWIRRLNDFSQLSLQEMYPDRLYPSVFGIQSFKILKRSRVTFNSHINVAEEDCGNMRMFEATGMGACLLTDWKSNLPSLFVPDAEVVTYRCAQEAAEKVDYLVNHDNDRLAIARAGQARTLRDHTYKNRSVQLNLFIQDTMKNV